jgi:hypothetical protein
MAPELETPPPSKSTSDAHIVSIANLLLASAASSSGEKQPFAIFDAIEIPTMNLVDYAKRIWKYFQSSHESHVLALLYVNRFLEAEPKFTLSKLNVHRLFLACTVVAAKFFDDSYLYNSFYAQVGGVSMQELNDLELKVLEVIRWKLHVDPAVYDKFNMAVLEHHGLSEDAIPIKQPTFRLPLAEQGSEQTVLAHVSHQLTECPTVVSSIVVDKMGDLAAIKVTDFTRATSSPIRYSRLLKSSSRHLPQHRGRRLRKVRSAA